MEHTYDLGHENEMGVVLAVAAERLHVPLVGVGTLICVLGHVSSAWRMVAFHQETAVLEIAAETLVAVTERLVVGTGTFVGVVGTLVVGTGTFVVGTGTLVGVVGHNLEGQEL